MIYYYPYFIALITLTVGIWKLFQVCYCGLLFWFVESGHHSVAQARLILLYFPLGP